MAQFYTKERSIGNASPQIYDDSQRVLKQAEDIIESMRAVSAIEEQQNATLINNLRAHRERDKALNTRNHQMLMDNMRQVAEVQQRNDQVAMQDKALKRREAAEQEQRTMKALASLSKVAAQAGSALVQQGLEQAKKDLESKIQTDGVIQQIIPQAKDADGVGHDAKLALDRQNEVANSAIATLAKDAGKDLNFVARLFISPERLERLATEVAGNKLAEYVQRGGLDDIIRQQPDKIVSYTFNGETIERPLSDVSAGKIQSSEEFNRIYTALNAELFSDLRSGRDQTVLLEADKKTRNAINSRVSQYNGFLARNEIETNNALKVDEIFLGETTDDKAKNAVRYVTEARANPTLGYDAATSMVTNKVLPLLDNPVAFAEAVRSKQHMNGGKIENTLFGTELLAKAQQLQRSKEEQALRDATTKGTNFGKQRFEASISDGSPFSTAEYNVIYQDIENKYQDNTLTFDEALAARNYVDTKYQSFSSNKAAVAHINELKNNQELTKETLDEFRSSIPSELYNEATEELESLDEVKLPNGLRYSQKTIRSQALLIATNIVKVDAISGQPRHDSVYAAADVAADEYLKRYKTYSEEFAPAIAAEKAWADVSSEMRRKEGIFFVDEKSGEVPFYSQLTSGDHSGAIKVPTRSTKSAQEIGNNLRGDGVSILDVKEYSDIDTNIPTYAAKIKAGQPIKLTSFDQAVADAAGIPAHEMLNRRFKALGIDAEATEGGVGILQRAAEISPELKRLINSPKTLNKLSSVTDRVSNVFPFRTGVGALGFHNVSSIARKFGHPNPELIAGIWSSQTNAGKNQPDKTPAQQVKEIIEQNPDLNMFIDYAEIAQVPQVDPSAFVYMQQYGDSHTNIAGMSKSTAATHRALHSSAVDRGGLFDLVAGGESSRDALIFNTGNTNSVGRVPGNSTFASVEQAQAAGKVFAAGSWQGTPGVLNQGRVAAGIADNANFNSLKNQSKAFWGLLLNTDKRPALRAYLLGQSNDINAAHLDLANEFAAIEGPSGRGSYDGDSSGNQANTKASAVRAALQQARKDLASNPINF